MNKKAILFLAAILIFAFAARESSAQPNTAIVSISVVTENRVATEAQQNAAQTSAVINALKRDLSAEAEFETNATPK